MMDRAALALSLLAIDPGGLRGLWLRARAGPVRDMVLAALPMAARRIHPGIGDDALFGGTDLAPTLATGRQVRTAGLLETPSVLILTMAERCSSGLAARLAMALDAPGHSVVALDEGADDEALPSALADRLGLFLDLGDVVWSDAEAIRVDADTLTTARARLPDVQAPKDTLKILTQAAAQLGIASLRAPTLALAAARASAALHARDVTDADLRLAAELVYAHRARPLPESVPPPPDTSSAPTETEADHKEQTQLPEDIVVEAARAALPAGLLDQLTTSAAARAAKGATGTGGAKAGNRRGRPMPSRAGRPGTGARIDLVATLRTAAPWQPLRRAQSTREATLHIRPDDIRLKRYVETSDRVLIFAVDASGSAAFARLAEAKGAVELLLAAAYARRDHVALLAFRGTTAELILPPTRSLVQTKRRLAGLPGGGGTPLAAGLQMALEVARQARARGMTPTIALMTDGRGNIALDGTPNRGQADQDAQKIATLIRSANIPALVIDTGTRPQPALALMARAMGAPCLPLPRADAHRLSAVLGAAIA
jgi:magnesium chelatase subunit D